jgi:hypothetical protein
MPSGRAVSHPRGEEHEHIVADFWYADSGFSTLESVISQAEVTYEVVNGTDS